MNQSISIGKGDQSMRTVNFIRTISFRLLLASMILLPLFAGGIGRAAAVGHYVGAVYALTNAADGNEVVVFNRAADGSLSAADSVSTGGLGTGSGLGSQGALVLSEDNRLLFAVNAGSNEISSFLVGPQGLVLVDKVASGGVLPISLTVNHNHLYVLNAGESGNISGFWITKRGKITPIPHSTRNLSNDGAGAAPGPAQISFSLDGNLLVVTEKTTNLIDIYTLRFGIPTGFSTYDSAGATPFGFAMDQRGHLLVSEAFGGAPGQSAVSSYLVRKNRFEVISPSVATHQTAACWVVITQNGKFTYTTNAGSGSISGYQVSKDGSLSLLDEDGVTGSTGDGSSPIDMSLSNNSRYLYALASGTHSIHGFLVGNDGSLTPGVVIDVPAGTVGLAAR
jgi:6-phosphogluconolactonase